MVRKGNTYQLNKLEQRIIDISYKKGLSHLGSNLTAVRLIDSIYQVKKPDDIFILSSGHAALALYVVLEKNGGRSAEILYDLHGTHPNRDIENGIYCSSGSLGHGIGIGLGMALGNKDRDVYVLMTDGECAEGSVWESLRIAAENRLENLKIMINANGWGALGQIDTEWLDTRLQFFYPSLVQRTDTYAWPDWLQGQEAHYHKLTKENYEEIIRQ